jgi:trigger factor
MRKRLLAAGLCVVMALSMVACGKDSGSTASSGNVGTVANSKADMTGTDYASKVTLGEYKNKKVGESTVAVDDETKRKINCLLITSGYFDIDTTSIGKGEGTIETFDIANIDFVGKIDGEEFDGGSGSDYLLGIGTGSFIDGFEDGLKGVQAGETVDLNLTFPESYSNEDVAGKDVVFTVTVNYIAEISDDFVSDNSDEIFYFLHEYFLNGKEVTTAKEYDEAISEGIKASNVASAIVEEITDDAETEIDETELNEYLDGIKDPIKEMAESNDTDFETIISYYYGFSTEEEFDEYYADIFRNYIILIAIAKEEGVEITEDEYNKVAQSMVDHSNGSYANIKEYQADYDKQTTVDDLICGKVYYILADSVEVVPDSEIETTTEETVEDTTEETEAAE